MTKYQEFNFDSGKGYVRKDAIEALKDVDAIIFDCDGVLIDTKGSYDETILKTIKYVLEGFTNSFFPNNLISDEIVFLFKKSGGFNSDWDICYTVLMFILLNLSKEYQRILQKAIENVDLTKSPLEKFLSIKNYMSRYDFQKIMDKNSVKLVIKNLKTFAKKMDESGVSLADKMLVDSINNSMKELYRKLRIILYYPPKYGKSIIPTVYEEIFCGPELTKEIFGVPPLFYKKRGLIENEQIIIKPETLDQLAYILGETNFGIASGSRFIPAKYILKNLLNYFSPEAIVFLDDVEKEEEKLKIEGKISSNLVKQNVLMKPHPFSLIKAVNGLKKYRLPLYIGDSMEDLATVENARKNNYIFIFAGVYAQSKFKEKLLQSFFKHNVEIILPSVNELPPILWEIKKNIKV
jgi:phosphoglycolate phosphatase-like HAD superfamily hydrolase